MPLNEQDKKIINERICTLFAFALVVGILLGGTTFHGGSFLWLLLPLLVVVLFFWKKPLLLGLLVVTLSFGFVVGQLDLAKYEPIVGEYTVSGVVVERNDSFVVLDHVTLDGVKEKGNLRLYLKADLGERITCKATLRKPSEYRFWSEYGSHIRFIASDATDVEREEEFHFFLTIRKGIRERLFSSMRGEEASLAYALLTGDTSYIESEVLENVRYGGIAHLFAVSGLHIGILYAILCFLTQKIKRYRPLIVVPVLFFYAGICSFSPSSLRATLMCSLSCLNHLIGKKSDTLELLSLSSFVMLAFSPAQVYRLGFRLSVFACISLACLSPYLRFERLPGRIASTLSGTLCAQIGVFPILMDTFGYVSIVGFFLNLLLIPLMAPLMVFLFIALLFPFFAFPAEGLLRGFLFLMNVSDFSLFLIEGLSFGLFVLPFYFTLFVGVGFVNVPSQIRKGLTALLAILTVVGVLFSSNLVYDCKIVKNEGGTLVRTKELSLLILEEETPETLTLLRKSGVNEVEVLFLSDEKQLSFTPTKVHTGNFEGDVFVTTYHSQPLVTYRSFSILVGVEESDLYDPLPNGCCVVLGERIFWSKL